MVKTRTSGGILSLCTRNSGLVFSVPALGKMASAGIVEASPKVPSKGVYQAFRESFSLLTVNIDKGALRDQSVATEIQVEKPREDSADTTGLSPEVKQTSKGDKPKNKSGKKKEIVSSSTAVPRLEVCIGKKCKARGSEALLTEFQTASEGRVEIAHTKCMHECKKGMNTRVTKDGTTFEFIHEVSTTDVSPILCKHFDW